MAENKQTQTQFSLVCKDIFASTLAGTAGIAITHPIDTIRIRMQLQPYPNRIYKTMLHWGWAALKREGVKGLFKGVISNSIGSAPIYTLTFTSKHLCDRFLKQFELGQQATSLISGSVAGVAGCITAVPAEMLKWRAQADKFNYMQ